MPRMLPAFPDPATPKSEQKVFEILAASLPDDWTVIHSRRITLPADGRHRAFQSEADFLIVDPDRGLLVLEVKGGREIGTRSGMWYSVDRDGRQHEIKNPAQQVERVMHRIKKVMEKQGRCPQGRRIAWGVCFPDVTARHSPDPGLPRAHVFDQSDLTDVRAAVAGAFDAQSIDSEPMSPREVRSIVDSMSPIFRFTRSLAASVQSQEKALLQLTDEQHRTLDVLDGNPRVVLEGAAGTGKTLVAMEKCRRATQEGKRALFLCYNKQLAKHLGQQASGFAVRTFHAEALRLCRDACIELPRDQKRAEFWKVELPELMQQAVEQLPDERYDAIFVDEGQDFEDMWWLPVQSLLRDEEESLFYVFLDPVQNLYGRTLQRELGAVNARLTYNCRNTQAIGTYSGQFVDRAPKFREATPEGDQVSRKAVGSADEMLEVLRQELHRVVREGQVSNRDVVVLSPVKESPAWKKRKIGPFELVDLDTPIRRSDQIRFSTIYSFKGLEADAVFIVDVTPAHRANHSSLLHVGTSRAKHLLTVMEVST